MSTSVARSVSVDIDSIGLVSSVSTFSTLETSTFLIVDSGGVGVGAGAFFFFLMGATYELK